MFDLIHVHRFRFPRAVACLGSAVLFLVFPLCSSQAQDNATLTESDAAKLLESLETFEEDIMGKKFGRNREVIDKLKTAASSEAKAYEFYLECVKKVRFTDEGKRTSEFRDWRERSEKRIRARSNQIALRLQLEYLILTIRAASVKKIDSEIPNLEAFVERMVSAYETMEDDRATLRESVLRSVFAQAVDLEKSFKPRDSWAKSPLDVNSIYTDVLLPFYRTQRSKALVASAWKKRILLLSKMAATWDEQDKEKFKTETLPSLQWRQECELIGYKGARIHINNMWSIIRSNPTHKDGQDWIDTLKVLLEARAKGEPLPRLPVEGEEALP